MAPRLLNALPVSVFFIGVYFLSWQLTLYVEANYDLSFLQLDFLHDFDRIFKLDIVMTSIIFIWSLIAGNGSIYDPYWSILPALLLFEHPKYVSNGLPLWIAAIVSAWGVRLTYNYIRSISTIEHEDWRIDYHRQQYVAILGKGIHTDFIFWLTFVLGGYHFFPTIIVFSGLIPAFDAINNYSVGYQSTDIVGLVIASISVLIQAIADQQLRAFRLNVNFNRKELLKDGLYYYSRHPNYAGELGLWLGLSIIGLGRNMCLSNVFGFIGMLCLFGFYSCPKMDERMLKSRPAYKQYMDKTPSLIGF